MDFLIKRNSRAQLHFAPLQGKTAKNILSEQSRAQDTIVYFKDGKEYLKSTAALLLLEDIGGFWSLFVFLLLVPRFLRDMIYDFIARRRYKIFGQREHCRLPNKEEEHFFLE